MTREIDPRIEASRCPFCLSDIPIGATVCASCGAQYGVLIRGRIILREEAEATAAQAKQFLLKAFLVAGAVFFVSLVLSGIGHSLGAVLFGGSLAAIPILGLLLIPTLTTSIPQTNSWHR